MANVMDVIREFNNTDEGGKHKLYVNVNSAPRSLSSQASKSTYFFPVLTSNSIDPDILSRIVENLEYQYCYFVAAAFSMSPAMKISDHKDVLNIEDYLKRFHQNVGIKNSNELFLSVKINENAYPKFLSDFPLNETSNDDNDSDDEFNESDYLNFARKSFSLKDLEKRNAIAASPVPVTVTFIFDGKKLTEHIIVGVKTLIHSTTSSDMVNQLSAALTNKGFLNKLVKYTSGEINSLKDLVFNSSDMKEGITGKSVAAKWFSIVNHRKRLNKLSMGLFAKKPYLPNVSIVVSSEDMAEISRKTGLDLMKNTSLISKFISDNFLLNFTVYDAGLETVYMMNDGEIEFTEIPLSTMKRNNSKESEIASQLIKALAK